MQVLFSEVLKSVCTKKQKPKPSPVQWWGDKVLKMAVRRVRLVKSSPEKKIIFSEKIIEKMVRNVLKIIYKHFSIDCKVKLKVILHRFCINLRSNILHHVFFNIF